MAGLRKEPAEGDDLVWGAAATKWTMSTTHIDDDGLAAVVQVMTGAKYWVLMKPKQPESKLDRLGDLSTKDAFPTKFSMGDTGENAFEAEGILLRPNTIL